MARHYKKNPPLIQLIIEFVTESHWSIGMILAISTYLTFNYLIPADLNPSSNEFINVFLNTLTKLLKTLSPYMAIGFILLSIVSVFNRNKKAKRLSIQKNLDTIKQLNWQEFEELVGEAYRKQGYKVIENAGNVRADGGIDLIIQKNKVKSLIQCKHWKQKIPVQIVREMYGVMMAENASDVKIITSSDFTREARDFAKNKPIELVTGKELLAFIGIKNIKEQKNIQTKLATVTLCPKCNGELVQRVARKGRNKGKTFTGCSNFPKCRYTHD